MKVDAAEYEKTKAKASKRKISEPDAESRIMDPGLKNRGLVAAKEPSPAVPTCETALFQTQKTMLTSATNRGLVAAIESSRPVSSSESLISQSQKTTLNMVASTSYPYTGFIHDIDERDSNDPRCVTEYVQDMFNHFRTEEHRSVVDPYMDDQPSIHAGMRGILIDWLAIVNHGFKFCSETFYLTVNIIDRCLSAKIKASSKNLQLIGVGALLIASKYEEIFPADITDLVWFCDKAYSRDEVNNVFVIISSNNLLIPIPTALIHFFFYMNRSLKWKQKYSRN